MLILQKLEKIFTSQELKDKANVLFISEGIFKLNDEVALNTSQ